MCLEIVHIYSINTFTIGSKLGFKILHTTSEYIFGSLLSYYLSFSKH